MFCAVSNQLLQIRKERDPLSLFLYFPVRCCIQVEAKPILKINLIIIIGYFVPRIRLSPNPYFLPFWPHYSTVTRLFSIHDLFFPLIHALIKVWATHSHQPQLPVCYCLITGTLILTRLDMNLLFCKSNNSFLIEPRTQLPRRYGVLLRLDSNFAHKDNWQYSLAPSPKSWGMPISIQAVEPDDYLHNPDPLRDRDIDRGGHIFTARGVANLGCLLLLGGSIMMLLYGCSPLIIFCFRNSALLFCVMQCWYVNT